MTITAFGYSRVSTLDQAEAALSLPDQRHAIEQYCKSRGWELKEMFEEPGMSGRDDNRPRLNRMLDSAMNEKQPVNYIVVHSFSRFFRDSVKLELTLRILRKQNIDLISVTQQMSNDSAGDMARRLIALFDEHNSTETAKHTARTMIANARAGYWNGSRPPLGYRTIIVDQHGNRAKKKLEIDPAEAPLVRRIFTLYLQGEDASGPLGVKRIADQLNRQGHRSRRNKAWTAKLVNETLRQTAYTGKHYYNITDSRNGKNRPREEWIEVPVPPIVADQEFQMVQQRLHERDPKMHKDCPAASGSPYLLSGMARCGHCGAALTAAPAKSRRYFYYACSTKLRAGRSACRAKAIPMKALDHLVLGAVIESVLTPEYIKSIATALQTYHLQRSGDRRKDLDGARVELDRIEIAIDKQVDRFQDGFYDGLEDKLRQRLGDLKLRRTAAQIRVVELEKQMQPARRRLSQEKIQAFGENLLAKLSNENLPARKAWLKCFAGRVVVTDNDVCITRPNGRSSSD